MTQFRKTQEKTVTLGYRLDLVFHLIRMGLYYMDHDLITRNLEKAQRYTHSVLPSLRLKLAQYLKCKSEKIDKLF